MARSFRAEIDIDAPIEDVWNILVDLERYPEWNPFTPHVESSLRVGEDVRLTVQMRPNKQIVQVQTVSAIEAGRKLCWGMKMVGPWVLAANRCQVLTPLDDRRTHYFTSDDFRGALVPVVNKLYGVDIQHGFDATAMALKKRAEL